MPTWPLVLLACYLVLHRPKLADHSRKISPRTQLPSYNHDHGSWLLALSQWQVLLSSDKFVERPDQTLLSLAHLPKNLTELLEALFNPAKWGDRIIPPYRPLLWLILLVGLAWP